MNQNEIREAYDRMNPPQEAKERMMQNLIKKTQPKKKSSARPTPYRRWTAIPAALALICVLAVGGWVLFQNSNQLPLVSPTELMETENMVSVPSESDLANVPDVYQDNQVAKDYTLSQAYAHVIEKYFKAYQENWSHEQYMENDICYVLKDLDFNSFGYTTMDLNGDDTVELIITDGNLIYDMYMLMDDGGAGHLISAGERMRYFLCEDNVIGYRGSSGASNSFMDFSRLLPGGDSEIVMYLQFDTNTWYKMEGGSDKMVAITEDEAQQIQDFYQAVEIPFAPFIRYEQGEEKRYPGSYAQMLQDLITQNPGVEDMYVSLVDVSGDGVSELLLGTENSFGHVYALGDGNVEYILSYGSDEGFTLCENGIIRYQTPWSNTSMYTFISMKDNKPITVADIRYDEDKDSWFQYINGGREYLTEAQVQDILDSYGTVAVNWITVKECMEAK